EPPDAPRRPPADAVPRLRLGMALEGPGGWSPSISAGRALRPLAALVSGALLAAAFPAPDLGLLALVALVPLLLATETVRPRAAAALGYLAGLTFFGLHLLWIAPLLSWAGAGARARSGARG